MSRGRRREPLEADEAAIKQARLGIEGEPPARQRCGKACGADFGLLFKVRLVLRDVINGTPFMCVGCGCGIDGVTEISEARRSVYYKVEALSTKCASLCGASSGLHGARGREEARRDEGLPAVWRAHPEPLRDVPGLRLARC